MNKNNNGTNVVIKRVKPRYIVINENIHEALDIYTLSLYMAFRYEADYAQEDAIVKRSAKFLYEKAKISRRQFFRCLNILEDFGLVLRDSSSQLNSVSIYHVAQDLNYFNTDCGVVPDVHGVVPDRHTDHYSFPLSNINITISDNSLIEEIKTAYHEELPELPKVKKVDDSLRKQLKKMVKDWPSYQKDGQEFTIQSFRDYLRVLKEHYGWFLKPYKTESGSTVKCTLRKLTREINITKVVNGEFSAE